MFLPYTKFSSQMIVLVALIICYVIGIFRRFNYLVSIYSQNCSNATSITTGGEGDQSQDLNRSHHSHHEHWNRSSLIMLAVAQASPRSHNAPPSVAGSTANTAGRQSLSHNDSAGGPLASPSKPFSGAFLSPDHFVLRLVFWGLVFMQTLIN